MTHPVVHFEIHGPDREGLQTYYGELFGWTFQDMPEVNYALVDTNGGDGLNGGIATAQDGKPRQIVYVSADDAQGTLDKAVALGAQVALPVSAIPSGPTIAIFVDKAGNMVGLVQPGGMDQASTPTKGKGAAVGWFELNGGDFETQVAFYSELFGWDIHTSHAPDFDYGEIHPVKGEPSTGAISVTKGGLTGTTLWAKVDDLQAFQDRAVALGGQADMPPAEVQPGLNVATFIDPQGNRIGLFKTA
jgi:hypothetical protein